MSGVEVIRAGCLGALPHGFLGRRGGVSVGELGGLNVGYGSKDDRAAIDENRRLAVAALTGWSCARFTSTRRGTDMGSRRR